MRLSSWLRDVGGEHCWAYGIWSLSVTLVFVSGM